MRSVSREILHTETEAAYRLDQAADMLDQVLPIVEMTPFEPSPEDRDFINNAPPPPLGAPSWADWYGYCEMRDEERRIEAAVREVLERYV
jgi:hypothetical protein